jgi:hypothetical protein
MSVVYTPTLSDFIARTRTYIDEAVQANYTNQEIIYALNDAQQELATEIVQVAEYYFVNPLPTVFQAVAMQQLYPLAPDFDKMVRLEIQQTGESVTFVDINEKTISNQSIPPLVNTAGYGAGFQAYMLGNDVGFTPIPTDSSMTFQYWYYPIVPDMVNQSDTSVIPRNFVDMLPMLATIDMFIKDEDDTAPILTKYNRRLDQLKRTARQRQVQNPKYVRRSDFTSVLYPWLQV